MKNNSIKLSVFIAFLTVGFISCAVYPKATTNKWVEYELPPSKIIKNGEVFFGERLSGGSWFSVFYDESINNDGEHYYAMLMQDWGWRRSGDTWSAPQGSRNIKRGHIYVNPSRRVAVYFYPERSFNAFKVSIK